MRICILVKRLVRNVKLEGDGLDEDDENLDLPVAGRHTRVLQVLPDERGFVDGLTRCLRSE